MRVLAALGTLGATALFSAALGAQPRPRLLCVRDAATGAGVSLVTVERVVSGTVRPIAGPRSECRAVALAAGDSLLVRRLGYAPWRGVLPDNVAETDTLFLHLTPVASMLAASVTRGLVTTPSRNASTREVDDARTLGVATSAGLVALLPYAQPRSARGEVSVSLRGTRREQVAITLDGLPLTDPATGVADVADVPLAVIGAATVAPGSDPLGTGPGAIGGVLALRTATASVIAARAGAFGAASVEGAHDIALGDGRLRLGASRQVARNDFGFDNRATTTGVTIEERRVNNDATRHALFAQWSGPATQLVVLGTTADLGLVGPVNVRDYDEDRSRTRRLFVRGSAQRGRALFTSGVRTFGLQYRDPSRPTFDRDANAFAADVDVRGTVRAVLLHAGLGADRLRADNVEQDRVRGFAAASHGRSAFGLDWLGGVRVDAIDGTGVLPSVSLAAERRGEQLTVGARVAQAVRVPTLYDLYFSSPQRLTVAALRAERVRHDAELFARWRRALGSAWTVALDASLVSREVRDAIVWFPGNFGWSPANVGSESLQGAEVRADVRRRQLELSAWYTGYRSELTSGALRIPTPYVPTHAGGAVVRVPLGPLQAGVATRWLGARPFTAGPRDPAFLLPEVALVDLSLAARGEVLGARMVLVAALDNATDRAWQSVRGFPSPGRSWSLSLTVTP
jgi:outer membrane cobalamin receptor